MKDWFVFFSPDRIEAPIAPMVAYMPCLPGVVCFTHKTPKGGYTVTEATTGFSLLVGDERQFGLSTRYEAILAARRNVAALAGSALWKECLYQADHIAKNWGKPLPKPMKAKRRKIVKAVCDVQREVSR